MAPQTSPPIQTQDLKKPPESKLTPPKQSSVYNPTISSLSKTATVTNRPRVKRTITSDGSPTKTSPELSSIPTPKAQTRNPFKTLFTSTKQTPPAKPATPNPNLRRSFSKTSRDEKRSSLPRPKSYVKPSDDKPTRKAPNIPEKAFKSTPNLDSQKSVNNNDLWIEQRNLQESNTPPNFSGLSQIPKK